MKKLLPILTIVLLGCAANKKVATLEEQPGWIRQKPILTDYYTGVGSAKKTGTFQEYSNQAKKDAMADLVQDIAVNVNTSSVLYTIESQYGYADFYDQQITISTEDYLEGFEPVAHFEDETTYWVYYRIGKNTYHANKAKRKEQAVENAKSKYLAGIESLSRNNPSEALSYFLQGLESINNYLAEETPVDLEGKRIDIGNKIFHEIDQLVYSLSIKPLEETLKLKRSKSAEDPIIFKTWYNDTPVESIPVTFSITGGYLPVNNSRSNAMGEVKIKLGPNHSKKEFEILTATIDLNKIANRSVEDLFIRGIINDFSIEAAKVTIYFVPVSVSLEIVDDCRNMNCIPVMQGFQQLVLQEGFEIQGSESADYIILMDFTILNGEEAGGLVSRYITGTIKILNKDQEMIVSEKIKQIKGVGRSDTAAVKKAFDEFTDFLVRIKFREVFDKLKSR